MPKETKSPFAILGMLSLYPNSSGYDIKKNMESSTQFFWKETFSSIYPVLEKLQKQKLVKKHTQSSQNKRQRHYYSLTTKGQQTLEDWLSISIETPQSRNELILKLFFGENVDPEINKKHLEEFQNMLMDKAKIYSEIKKEIETTINDKKRLFYWLITLDYGMMQVQSALEWCKRALANIEILTKAQQFT